MTGKPKIELRAVKKRFGPKIVLDGVDLVVNEGDSLVVIGGSGSGKSVTIKCVLGIIRADSGTILVDGKDVTHINGAARESQLRKFGMLFQGGALFDSLPVWENVAFGLIQGRGVSRNEARGIALEKLAKVGLGAEVANLSPAELSGGMQKRVGLRALYAIPNHLLRRTDDGRDPSWPESSTIHSRRARSRAHRRFSITHASRSRADLEPHASSTMASSVTPDKEIEHSGIPMSISNPRFPRVRSEEVRA